MKHWTVALAVAATMSLAAPVWAGPVEEVNEIAAPRVKALAAGDADAWTAAFANDAVLHTIGSPLRLEGREAIRSYFTAWFQLYPKRKLLARAPLSRTYGDSLVIQDGHGDYYLTDQQGKTSYIPIRWSIVWSKVNGQWQIVEQHGSRLPDAED